VHVLFPSFFGSQLVGINKAHSTFGEVVEHVPHVFKRIESLALQQDGEDASYVIGLLTMPWFVTLFSDCLPNETLSHVWDSIFCEEATRSHLLPLSCLLASGLTLLLFHETFHHDYSGDDATQNVLDYINSISKCAGSCQLNNFEAIWKQSLIVVEAAQHSVDCDGKRIRQITVEAEERLLCARALLWTEVDRQDERELIASAPLSPGDIEEDITALELAIAQLVLIEVENKTRPRS
jgi:hypothetical protein